MPPWVAFAPRPTSLLGGNAIGKFAYGLRCRYVTLRRPSKLSTRCASTHVSPTAINLRPNIPPRNQELYNVLSELSGKAEAYVNLSRLQLALRGLQAEDAVTRIAVLSLNNQISAQKLARLLLADPLGTETQWEKELEKSEDEEGRAVLLRYGDESDAHPPTPLYKILSIPSQVLRTHNLEVLVSTLNVDLLNTPVVAATERSKDAILVPKLLAASTKKVASGIPVPYPVHKTLVLGEGLDSIVAYGRFTSGDSAETEDMVKLAIDLPPPSEETQELGGNTCSLVNARIGTEALASFRESITNSDKYERGWFKSGLPSISKWFLQGLAPSEPIKPVTKALISSITDDVETNITKEDSEQLQKLASTSTPQQISNSILGHLESWAEQSHTELRDQLDEAFVAKNWHKLAWWKLFWRVDDVSMITSEILERRWLVDAEKSAIYLAGRMNQAGFSDIIEHIPEALAPSSTERHSASLIQTQSPEPSTSTPKQTEDEKVAISTEVKEPQPWPSLIPTSRTHLQTGTIPILQSLSQRLVLTTLSTTSLSTALSALLYVSMPTFSLFEASAVAALGFVYSLRRMQKLWETARSTWQVEVREEGRKTLKATEEMVRLIVRAKEKGDMGAEDAGVRSRREAREAVRRVREALERIEKVEKEDKDR